ncbi:MAG: CHAD domain-containing protein [Caulobacterales bacterium]
MAKAPREIELKFVLPRERLASVLAESPALCAAPPKAMTSTYFDTDRRSLRTKGFSLRVRRVGAKFVQTVKRGDAALDRGEWESPVAGPGPDVTRLMGTPAGKALRSRPRLKPLFNVDVARRAATLTEGECVIELCLDDAQVKTSNRKAAFAELELELKAGPVVGLLTFARKLAAGQDLTVSLTAKSDRGFMLLAAGKGRAVRFTPPQIDPKQTAGQAFRLAARACLRQIAANAEALRERASPEVVHQLRVGLRRLRSLFTTFKPLVQDASLDALKAELKWLTTELDAARNLDVLIQGDYRAALGEHENAQGLKDLGARLRAQRRLAYARAAAAVESQRFRRLLFDTLAWTEMGAWTARKAPGAKPRERRIRKFAVDALEKRRRRIMRDGKQLARLDAGHLHRLRIEAKKLRYAADVFGSLFGQAKRFRHFVGSLKALQDTLGQLNDITVGQSLAHDVAAAAGWPDAEAAFAAGRITGAQKARAERVTAEAAKAFDGFAQAKPFWD